MALQTLQAPCLIGEQVRNVADDEFTGARAISSMAISSAPGTTFAFEFIDNPDDEGSASRRASAPWVTNMRRAAMLTVTTLPFS